MLTTVSVDEEIVNSSTLAVGVGGTCHRPVCRRHWAYKCGVRLRPWLSIREIRPAVFTGQTEPGQGLIFERDSADKALRSMTDEHKVPIRTYCDRPSRYDLNCLWAAYILAWQQFRSNLSMRLMPRLLCDYIILLESVNVSLHAVAYLSILCQLVFDVPGRDMCDRNMTESRLQVAVR